MSPTHALALMLTGVMLMTGCAQMPEEHHPPRVQVIAHRGASEYAPENTLAAYALAAKMKADWFELDCLLSRDGEVFICHDTTLDRTTNGTGRASGKTLAELRTLDAGSWKGRKYAGEKLPTLREALELGHEKQIGVYIEVKDTSRELKASEAKEKKLKAKILNLAGDRTIESDPALGGEIIKAIEEAGTPNLPLARKTYALIRELGMQKQVVVQSFSEIVCTITRIEAPELRVELLIDDKGKDPNYWPNALKFVRLMKAAGLNMSDKMTTPEKIKTIHDQGGTVAVWTVNDAEPMAKFAAMGADAIITNRPDLCLKTLRKNGLR